MSCPVRRAMMSKELKYFKYDHLPEHVQAVSKPFGDLANEIVEKACANEKADTNQIEKAVSKLLEAKDCAVRGLL